MSKNIKTIITILLVFVLGYITAALVTHKYATNLYEHKGALSLLEESSIDNNESIYIHCIYRYRDL